MNLDFVLGRNLTIEMLPKPDDRDSIFAFAMTFNGYEQSGSFDESARKARDKSRNSLDELRNELFFSARASRHRGDELYLDTYRELYPLIVTMLESG